MTNKDLNDIAKAPHKPPADQVVCWPIRPQSPNLGGANATRSPNGYQGDTKRCDGALG